MAWMRDLVFWLSKKKALTRPIARTGMRAGFARRFVAGESLEDGLRVARELNTRGMQVNMNHLGENVTDRREAETACESYLKILRQLDERRLDGSVSIKPTQLGLSFAPELCRQLTLRIVQEAARLGNFVEIDMEDSPTVEPTVSLFAAVRRDHANVGLAIQSYLYRSRTDLERLQSLKPKIRLVKGAYREPPSVAFAQKKQVDENYRALLRFLFSNGFTVAVATHDENMIQFARQMVGEQRVSPERWEYQMILGVRRDRQEALVREGYRMRVYIPFGSEWLPYFMRRMAERPANFWFVAKSLLRGG